MTSTSTDLLRLLWTSFNFHGPPTTSMVLLQLPWTYYDFHGLDLLRLPWTSHDFNIPLTTVILRHFISSYICTYICTYYVTVWPPFETRGLHSSDGTLRGMPAPKTAPTLATPQHNRLRHRNKTGSEWREGLPQLADLLGALSQLTHPLVGIYKLSLVAQPPATRPTNQMRNSSRKDFRRPHYLS